VPSPPKTHYLSSYVSGDVLCIFGEERQSSLLTGRSQASPADAPMTWTGTHINSRSAYFGSGFVLEYWAVPTRRGGGEALASKFGGGVSGFGRSLM